MKYEEDVVRGLLANISPISPECDHSAKITVDLSEVTDDNDVKEFRDRASEILKMGDFTESSVSNPFGVLKTKINKEGIKETKEDFKNITLTIKYLDDVKIDFEIKRVVEELLPILNKFAIKVASIQKVYNIKAGKPVIEEDELDDVKEL